MSILTDLEINEVCRTCLIRSDDMTPLYESCSREIDLSLAEMLTSFTSLKCFTNDGLPKQMCYNCMGELNRFYIFQLKCVESDALLRRFIQKTIKIESQQIDDAPPQNCNNYEFANVKVEVVDESYTFTHPDCQSSVKRVEIAESEAITSLRDPLTTTELQNDLDQKFINDVSAKTELDDVNLNCEVNVGINSGELVESLRQVKQSGAKRFLCPNCDKSYKLKAHLTIHMRQHTGEKPYACKLCDKSFYRKTQLNRHVATHSREKPFSCTICQSAFYHKDYLVKHMQTHTEAKPYACTLCTVSFSRKEHLKRHMQTHTGEKPFVCAVCTCTFQRKHILKIHMRTHTGEKPYTCAHCDRAFIRKAHLTRHQQTHTREKPYACTMCERSFQRKELLTIHMRKHTGEKPYACTVCDSSFHRKQILTVHMRNHTGEKPFSCTICASTFKQKSHLTFHMWKHN